MDVSKNTIKSVILNDFRLQSGVVMPSIKIAYRTEGRLSSNHDNVVLVTHGNTSGPSMLDTGAPTGEGTWSTVVGPGKAIDTDRYFVICPNMLGSSYGSTNAASIDPATGKAYGPRFPDITVGDIVASQRKLLDHLDIPKLVAIAGPSYGGMQGFQWAVDYPDDLKGLVAVVTAPFIPRPLAKLNFGRLIKTLSRDPNWNGGDYYDRGGVLETLIGIRIRTLKIYGVAERLRDTISDEEGVERAIRASATRWAQEFDANSLIILAKALIGYNTILRFRRIKAKTLYVLSRTDKIFRPVFALPTMSALKLSGVDAGYFKIDSKYGHMASGEDGADKWTPRLRQFLSSLE
ncbi:alpha/beta fold hydrolase [Burkholderia gladioli]|uniref:alpha/beta fold hydrolase n=1 Tax=Burkholderia gladioli TaxID=28095 RepID=UPI00163EAB4C|nr:alpha/beta fold hydrolase [Burkholderia gladioli]